MVATVSTFAATLQKYYLPGVNKQLNNGTFLLSEIEKAKVKWDGGSCEIHAHVGRNDGVGFSNGKIPTAGTQKTVRLSVTAKRFYGAFSVDGMLIESAPENGGHAFISWAQLEMDGLVDDVKVALNEKTVSGGQIKGFLNEHKLSTTTAADIVKASANAQASTEQVWEYSGHFDEFNGSKPNRVAVDTTDETTWVPVELVRMDTFNPVDYASSVGVPTGLQVWVTGYDEEDMTISLRVTCNNAGTLVSNVGFTTVSVKRGHAIALRVEGTAKLDSTGAAALGHQYVTTEIGYVGEEANGIFSCLALPSYYGQTRNAADATALPAATVGTAPALRCQVRTMETASGSNHARTAITGPRMERMKNIIEVACGKSKGKTSSIFVHPYFKATYSALGIITHNVTAQSATKLDIGFAEDGYYHGGTKMRSDRHIPRGLMIFFNKKSWKLAELGKGKFADQDGSVFSRSTNGRDEWEGFWRKYYNLVCVRPHANMILTGFSI